MIQINKIHCMDALDGLKQIPDESIDLIITDPPYNINLKPQRGKTKSILNDNLSEKDFSFFLNNIFIEIHRVLKKDAFVFVFVGWSTIPIFRNVLDNKFNLKSMPIWVKNNFGIGYYTRPQYEPILFYIKGKKKKLKKPVSDVFKFKKVHRPIHSCEKPVALIEHILKHFSENNDVVLDPFMGSGTTAVACKKNGRNYIGFELEQKYVDIANKRLEQNFLTLTGDDL